jgi:ABC-type uncharacterized transport system permease subunit
MFTALATSVAATSAVLAFGRLGAGQSLAFAVVAVVLAVLAVFVLRGARWALWVSVVGSGGQAAAVIGTVWELAVGIDAGKARNLRRLGFDPTLGVVINLVYSAVASVLFGWLVVRWWRLRRSPGAARKLEQ